MLALLNESAEIALDLIEKNGNVLPFCRARRHSGEILFIMSESSGKLEDALASVLDELRRRLAGKEIAEFAICSDLDVKFAHLPNKQRCLRVEFQNGSENSAVYYFPLSVSDCKANLATNYIRADLPEKLL